MYVCMYIYIHIYLCIYVCIYMYGCTFLVVVFENACAARGREVGAYTYRYALILSLYVYSIYISIYIYMCTSMCHAPFLSSCSRTRVQPAADR